MSTSSDIWSMFESGRTRILLAAQQKVEAANYYNKPMEHRALVDDPALHPLLVPQGYRIGTPTYSHKFHGTRLREVWLRDYTYESFLTDFAAAVAAQVENISLPDGRIHQRLTTEAIAEAWEAKRAARFGATARVSAGKSVPQPEHLPAHAALAIHALPKGRAWKLIHGADGSAIERVLPAQPVRVVVDDELPYVEFKHVQVRTVAWGVIPPNTPLNSERLPVVAHLSIIGHASVVHAGWASLMTNNREEFKLKSRAPTRHAKPETVIARRKDGKGIYEKFVAPRPLDQSGMHHLIVQLELLLSPQSGRPFLHLTSEDGEPLIGQLAEQIAVAVPYFIAPEHAARAWAIGLETTRTGTTDASDTVIKRLPSYGCALFAVYADDPAWATIAVRCMRCSATPTSVTIHTVGGELPRQLAAEEDDGE